MKTTDALSNYFRLHTDEIVDDWLNSREGDPFSIFDLNAPKDIEAKLMEESGLFVRFTTEALASHAEEITPELLDWSHTIAKERVHDGTSIDKVLEQFQRFRLIYFQYLKEWLLDEFDLKETAHFNFIEHYHYLFDEVINTFVTSYKNHYEKRLKEQMGLINELSSPIILLSDTIGILPLVGDIDERRAKYIIEHALEKCMEKEIQHLVVDLSAVPVIDTMVAQKIFELMNTLTLIGVHALITGIRPAIAQTAVQLGIPLGDLTIHSSLMHALKSLGYHISPSH
ncbi:STAS domain-containing protein [Bacillus sp. KH172YL63]|uniref:STAS domain-containing protein n=1 Tax=Bacillus sp. KH172YL63 TaxID=2709784 RepID=UPI0013E4A55A|nr:STAS domain-containing protein [Bacillus sp. KH172YL63]BCB02591.1 RsbT co-antagonist protein RsbRB [Bacillus sp. KH172YL63]